METGPVVARTIYLRTGIDEPVRFGFEPLEEVQSFLVAKYAMVCPKSLDCAKGVAFPQKMICCHVLL